MTRYSEEFKKSIIKKILSNQTTSLRHVAKENGLALSTTHGWLKKYGSDIDKTKELNKRSPNDWTLEERFNILAETAGLTEEARGIYCRQKGIYQYQLDEWREIFMKTKIDSKNNEELGELKALRAENKALKKELLRKDKALAETSALLILKKKADYLWGEIEED
jgi:transposase-like protein